MPKLQWMTVLVLFFLTLAVRVEAAATKAPHELIDERYRALKAHVDSGKLNADMSEDALYALLEKELSPVVAFPYIARKVMGKFHRRSNEAQLARFTDVFKRTLIRTYGKGLKNLHELDRVDIDKAELGKKPNRSRVRTRVVLKNGEAYEVVYSLFQADGQPWMVENIVAEGLNMGLVFRNQFAHLMETHGSIDKAIDHWGEVEIDTAASKQGADAAEQD